MIETGRPTCESLVMIVEDDVDVRESIAEVLEDNEYQSLGAANGKEAIEQLRAGLQKPCVILLDIMMPVMDGWQFRALQREDPELGSIPVVVLTAHADLQQADEMAAAACLKKPVRLDTLLATVQRFCRKPAAEPNA
jgi:CheY-like chemotaxis protein